MDYCNSKLSDEELKEISKEVALIEQEYSIGSRCIRDEIFVLLEKVGTLISFPFDEPNLWGIYISKDEKDYFIINTAITLEKRIFAAAHELAHSLDIAKVKFEIVTAELMTDYIDNIEYGEKLLKADLIANRFAAELLVGKKILKLKYDELPEEYDYISKAILLSDIFLVPYKTIVKRFIEVGIVKDESIAEKLLNLDTKNIQLLAKRFECCSRNEEITNEKRLGGYTNKALLLFENELSTYKELKERLKLIDDDPENYNILDDDYDNYKYLKYAAENPEIEDGIDD